MFSGLPDQFEVKTIKQEVPCKNDPRNRFVSKNEGVSRVQLRVKRSKICSREYDAFTRAMKETKRNSDKEKEEFERIRKVNNDLHCRNASGKGRLLLTKAAALEVIGDNVEEVDTEHGNEEVKITLVQKVETKTLIVQQGGNRTKGQEIMTVFTKTGLETQDLDDSYKEEQDMVCSSQEPGRGCTQTQ